MLEKFIFLQEIVIQNNPRRETLTAGLGPVEQYGIALLALIIIGIIIYIRRKRKKKSERTKKIFIDNLTNL